MLSVARRELQLQLRDGRLAIAALLLLLLLSAATVVGWAQYEKGEAQRVRFAEESYAQWLNQGPKHPHRAAAYGMYVAKPETPLAVFEPGLRPFAGRTLWLQAHSNAAFSHAPADDDLTASPGLGETSGAALLQLLGGLFAMVLGALSVARDRETGVMRQILAQGISPRRWIGGKCLGLVAALLLPLVPFAILLIATTAWAAAEGAVWAAIGRTAAALGATLVYLLGLLAIGVAVSAFSRTSRGALVVVLSLWVAGSVLAPRAASLLTLRIAPTPDAAVYASVIRDEFNGGYGERPGWDDQLAALEDSVKAEYGLSSLDEAPVGFSGLRMQAMDAWTNEVADRHHAQLLATYDRQQQIRTVLSVFAPYLAARAASHGFAGMDWAHYQHFAAAAEEYRRAFNVQMNEAIVAGTRGQAWEMNAGRETWALAPPFTYQEPGLGWALRAQWPAVSILVAWLFGALGLLAFAAQRLRP
ncbi:MAG: DUF3526 domain-containing protein [Phenylobacterium sp.]|uniref:DUF3526 domain-containing protein n=1 Tax=Phenylobacterium sp. TaxID=1871053 RepID=UPI0027283AFE|nr:DUF3526 domain-containing protein [Phenylobacterium sp.]MDO8902526.1 DUF3526 domain-containing protein [Phenylobacterium sp.]